MLLLEVLPHAVAYRRQAHFAGDALDDAEGRAELRPLSQHLHGLRLAEVTRHLPAHPHERLLQQVGAKGSGRARGGPGRSYGPFCPSGSACAG